MPKFEFDFFEDLRRETIRELKAAGVSVPQELERPSTPSETAMVPACELYWNTRLRAILPRRYAVALSRDVRAHLDSPTFGPRLREIMQVADRGGNLNPFQSNQYKKAGAFDPLLADWGIRHFHLGGLQPDGTVGRDGPLLFVLLTDHVLHFIDVRDHKSFESIALLQTAFDNWPHLFDVVALEAGPQLSEEELRLARRKVPMNVAVTLRDGEVICCPGGGVLNSGLPLQAGMLADEWCNLAAHLTEVVPTKAAEIAARLEQDLGQLPDPIRLQVRLTRNGLELVEVSRSFTLATQQELIPHMKSHREPESTGEAPAPPPPA